MLKRTSLCIHRFSTKTNDAKIYLLILNQMHIICQLSTYLNQSILVLHLILSLMEVITLWMQTIYANYNKLPRLRPELVSLAVGH